MVDNANTDERRTERQTEEPAAPDPTDPSTWEDGPPEGAIASADDFKIQRDETGELQPVWEQIPGTERFARILPISQGRAERYIPESGDPGDMGDRAIVELLNHAFKEPEFALDPQRAEEEIQDFKAFSVEPLIMAVYNASGFEFTRGMLTDNSELVEAVEGNTETGN